MANLSIIAITKHGIAIARRLKSALPDSDIYAPVKLSDGTSEIFWFSESTGPLMGKIFKSSESIVCIFSLGAVIRLISPHLVDKKTDPAVVVIDDNANFVISALSGHLGGANALAKQLSTILGARAVITTAADVNKTIAVDLLGHDFGWTIEDFRDVTKSSALMVNSEKIAVFQDSGEENWWPGALPANVTKVESIERALSEEFKAALIISDRVIDTPKFLGKTTVVYRPKSLVIGVGLHWDTDSNTIDQGVRQVLEREGLAFSSIRNIASIDRGSKVKGLDEFCQRYGFETAYFSKEVLAQVQVPNPSEVVKTFEKTASVAEASCILSSKGSLIVQKQKFPPNLTIAVARANYLTPDQIV